MASLSRRRFFGLLAAPAIVRASSLMPISVFRERNRINAFYQGVLIAGMDAGPGELVPVFTVAQMRNLLLPGLASIEGRYPQIPRAFQGVFAQRG